MPGPRRGIFYSPQSQVTEYAKPGEVVYRDENDILCRRWNWRECDKTKMTEATRNVVLVTEALPPFTLEDMQNITAELQDLVKEFCEGEVQSWILDHNYREAQL